MGNKNVSEEKEEKENENENESFFHRGDKILLCDLGGGTADIACHEIDENERIRQIVAPSGGAWGSAFVDDHFVTLLTDIFGAEWMTEFQREYPTKFVELLCNFRNSKRSFDG